MTTLTPHAIAALLLSGPRVMSDLVAAFHDERRIRTRLGWLERDGIIVRERPVILDGRRWIVWSLTPRGVQYACGTTPTPPPPRLPRGTREAVKAAQEALVVTVTACVWDEPYQPIEEIAEAVGASIERTADALDIAEFRGHIISETVIHRGVPVRVWRKVGIVVRSVA